MVITIKKNYIQNCIYKKMLIMDYFSKVSFSRVVLKTNKHVPDILLAEGLVLILYYIRPTLDPNILVKTSFFIIYSSDP